MFFTLAATLAVVTTGNLVAFEKGKVSLGSSPISLAEAPKLPERFKKKGVGVLVIDDSRNTAAQYVDGVLSLACRVATAAPGHKQLRGMRRIRRPARWHPVWRPTEATIAEYARHHQKLPRRIPYGNPLNQLGVVCLDLVGESYIKIHATTQDNIGKDCTRGCFGLLPGDAVQMIENWRKAKRLYLYVYN